MSDKSTIETAVWKMKKNRETIIERQRIDREAELLQDKREIASAIRAGLANGMKKSEVLRALGTSAYNTLYEYLNIDNDDPAQDPRKAPRLSEQPQTTGGTVTFDPDTNTYHFNNYSDWQSKKAGQLAAQNGGTPYTGTVDMETRQPNPREGTWPAARAEAISLYGQR